MATAGGSRSSSLRRWPAARSLLPLVLGCCCCLWWWAPSAVVGAAVTLQCNATVAAQSNLERWSLATGLTFSRDSHAAAVLGDRIYLVGGVSTSYYTKRLDRTTFRSDVVSTADGEVWTEHLEEAPFRRRYGHSLTTFADADGGPERLVLMGGFSPEPATDIWTSTDGATWNENTAPVPWSGRGYHCAVAFDKRLWVLGGSPINNDVWSTASVQSGTWTQQSGVPWAPRAAHACAAHKVMANVTLGEASIEEFLFLMGGWDDASFRDVWRMDAAGTWTRLLEEAPWKKRAWHAIVSFDSRTHGDIVEGPRLWLIGGGIIGRGVEKMFPYTDVWFTRDGVTWTEASSAASGISTAEWSMVSTREKDVCLGKWGHVVVVFHRKVPRSFYCSASCVNEGNTTSLARQVIPVCDPARAAPDPPVLKTILRQNSVTSQTMYPDGCGLCVGSATDRYVADDKVPALFLIAGNVGVQKVKDVFVSNDAMLCERDGVICSNLGVCTLGGTCLCTTGKTGQFCDDDLDYQVLEQNNCFPGDATVVTRTRGRQRLAAIAIGDEVLAVDPAMGRTVFSPVYYLPHDPQVANANAPAARILRIHHAPPGSHTGSLSVHQRQQSLDITPRHLLYIRRRPGKGGEDDASGIRQVAAHEVRVGDLLLWAPIDDPITTTTSSSSRGGGSDGTWRLGFTRVTAITVRRTQDPAKAPPLLTVYTLAGTVVVDDVVCSNFADLYPHLGGDHRDGIPWLLFFPHRVLFAVLPYPATAQLLRALTQSVLIPIVEWLAQCIPVAWWDAPCA